MKLKYLVVLIFSVCIVACIPPTQEPITEVNIDVNSSGFRKVYTYQDEQKVDSLLTFSNHFDPSYRFLVANAMASIQSEKGLDSLYVLMNDPVMKVRTAAAYAIGQIGKSSSTRKLLEAFKTKDTLDVNNPYNAAILEAIGKVAKKELLPPLATVSTYRKTDTLLLEGQSRAIYNYALRGIVSTEGTDKMVQYLSEEGYPEKVKLIAANYLARAKGLDIETFKFRLTEELTNNTNPDIRMAVALALGKTQDNEVYDVLNTQLETEKDYRVGTNIIRSMGKFPYIKVVERMLTLLKDKNVHVANSAADYLLKNGNSYDAPIYRNYMDDSLHYTVQAKLYAAILEHMPVYYTNTKAKIKKDILTKIEESNNTYEQVAFIKALGHDPYNVEDIIAIGNESRKPVIRSTAAEGVANILRSPNFVKAYRGGHLRRKGEILDLIKEQFKNGDSGVLAIYGDLLSDTSLDLKTIVEDPSFVQLAMQRLKLPREIETYNNLAKAYAHLTGTQYTAKTPKWNHPIDWKVFDTYGDSIFAAIKTEKGVVRLVLYANQAPGTVATFVSLANENFFDGKNFHRVVPNFVIQGGCTRGDGYGSMDFSIRSELPQLYYDTEGVIGMASAGLHTEGTQFFITHSPTMHLSGKYTIFGKVIDGMDVVHRVEVGDKIDDVIITKL